MRSLAHLQGSRHLGYTRCSWFMAPLVICHSWNPRIEIKMNISNISLLVEVYSMYLGLKAKSSLQGSEAVYCNCLESLICSIFACFLYLMLDPSGGSRIGKKGEGATLWSHHFFLVKFKEIFQKFLISWSISKIRPPLDPPLNPVI